MLLGKMYKLGNVVIAKVQYTDTFEIKRRPAIVLFEEYGNVICVAITSNPAMQGIPLTKEEGAIKDSVIKLNYIFTISEKAIDKMLFAISKEKKELIRDELIKKLN